MHLRSLHADAESLRDFHSCRALADELGMRQQTISEWETGVYQPRGASVRLLSLVAARAGFRYEVGKAQENV